MTEQTDSRKCLRGSLAGWCAFRLCTLTLAATLFACAAATGLAQAQPDAAKPVPAVMPAKPAAEPAHEMAGGYLIHQSIEVGGRITTVTGSDAMWDTLVNQGSGGRVLGQSLEMRSINNSRTPFFDSLTAYSTGYGGDPLNVTRLKVSKGRWYDFNSSFRRDRNYFDYNLLDQSLLGSGALVAEPDSLHLFNTVRRNTDTTLTLLPLSFISFRAGFNHGTHEGPSYTSVHEGGDAQLLQWFRNSSDTYTGGVDVKLAKRTTLSYDQFFVLYKGDSSFQLTGANYMLSNGQPVSLGVDTLSSATCGTGANKTLEVVNGVANPYCNGFLTMSQTAPTRTQFPSEQLRFSTHYWDRIFMNARALYSGATGSVNNFNETFNGLTSRTAERAEIDTGGFANGQVAQTKRVNVNADYGIVAELNKYFSVSDAFDYWDFRVPGTNNVNSTVYTDPSKTPSMLDPLSSMTPVTTNTVTSNFLTQRIESNTLLAIATITPEVKLSGGWRVKTRNITDSGQDNLTWNINGAILGIVIQPSRMVRVNVDYDSMNSKGSNAMTPSNSFTREAPDKENHLRARASVKPAKWINLAITSNDYSAKNDDPLVNHVEHNRDLSFATSIIAGDGLSLDFNYAHDSVFSVTDICYPFTPTATEPLPPGAANTGTCVLTASNPGGSPSLYLGNASYNVPTNFFSGALSYSSPKYFRFNGGVRLSASNGQAEMLNALMVPGAIQSKYLTPYTDMQINIASQWAWHGNWTHDAYAEGGPIGYLPSRNTHGDIFTVGVKYAF
jgi:hypothetical protein